MTQVAYVGSTAPGVFAGRWEMIQKFAPDSLELRQVDPDLGEGEMIEALAGVEAVIAFPPSFSTAVAEQCPDLKLIQVLAAGYEDVDVAAMRQLGIAVANNGGSNAVSVSEHSISLMLALYRRLMHAWQNTKAGKWTDGIAHLPFRSEITGKTVGIVGFGNIGRQVARRLAGFDCRILYFDFIDEMPGRELEFGARYTAMDELLEQSDIVTLHVPHSDATTGLISKRELRLMKRSAILINTCRGPVVDEQDLIDALNSGEIAGAGLDVLIEEPTPPDNPLLSMDNVIITPHWAGGTREGSERSLQFSVDQCVRLSQGRPLLSLVNA